MTRFCSFSISIILIIFISCNQINSSKIDENKFIIIYSRLLVLNKLNISDQFKNKLITNLLQKYNVKSKHIQSSIAYYQQNPQDWAELLEKVNAQIIELHKNKYRGEELEF